MLIINQFSTVKYLIFVLFSNVKPIKSENLFKLGISDITFIFDPNNVSQCAEKSFNPKYF